MKIIVSCSPSFSNHSGSLSNPGCAECHSNKHENDTFMKIIRARFLSQLIKKGMEWNGTQQNDKFEMNKSCESSTRRKCIWYEREVLLWLSQSSCRQVRLSQNSNIVRLGCLYSFIKLPHNTQLILNNVTLPSEVIYIFGVN